MFPGLQHLRWEFWQRRFNGRVVVLRPLICNKILIFGLLLNIFESSTSESYTKARHIFGHETIDPRLLIDRPSIGLNYTGEYFPGFFLATYSPFPGEIHRRRGKYSTAGGRNTDAGETTPTH